MQHRIHDQQDLNYLLLYHLQKVQLSSRYHLALGFSIHERQPPLGLPISCRQSKNATRSYPSSLEGKSVDDAISKVTLSSVNPSSFALLRATSIEGS